MGCSRAESNIGEYYHLGVMDVAEVEESLFAASDAKLHGGMCRVLSGIVCKILGIFPVLEAARPRSKSGIQALCSVHVALEKAKNLLQHCSDCSKLYLAITGDSVLLKFEKARSALGDSLRRVEDIVPQAVGCQISEIVNELEATVFTLDPSEKQVGDEVIALLQLDRKFNGNCNDNNELETFHQAASRLGITSSRAALTERRALKKLIERARVEEDKRKESIVAYLLHLMRKYSKLFRSEFSDDNDSQGSAPCSPTVQGSLEDCGGSGANGQAFERQLSKLCSFNFKPRGKRSGHIPVPPEELRCPISLQLMYDPVIISSGQTYERVCIEKWFNDGHSTCPKTQQQLDHLFLTPNYCVKGLIAGWCDQNGVPAPDGPPDSLDLNYWRLALSESETTNSRSIGSINSSKLKGIKVVPLEDGIVEEVNVNEISDVSGQDCEVDMFERYESLLAILRDGGDMRRQCQVVEQIRRLLKDDEEGRMFMGANGLVEELVRFLGLAVRELNGSAQEIGAMALFNLAVNNNRNKEMMLSAGVIPLLEEMILNPESCESASALYLNLSCLEEAKPIIGSSQAVPFLVQLLQSDSTQQCKLDALHTLYNLSTQLSNTPHLLSAGIIEGLQTLLTDHSWVEKTIAVFINIASNKSGKAELVSAPGLVSKLAAILDIGEPIEQEQAVSCILILCSGDDKCSDLVLQEGVIPALVSISVNGTNRGKEKAQKLLMLFREQRQRDPSPVKMRQPLQECSEGSLPLPPPEPKPLYKSTSKRLGKGWSSIWKSKPYSVHQY
ncbi:Armadillo [Macleaya cordata]|uniref:RING-type E3 ubiquitin transferase n=1 Tax=Macleaya cordata TaxID=56857 RepID=A0A200R489_MACCD|nr:Armadillo [Macleaya cordata]